MIVNRTFSEDMHLRGVWHTSILSVKNRLVFLLCRFLSFKYQEMYHFSRKCNQSDLIIDFGCGTGVYSRYCRAITNAKIIAIDWSEKACRTVADSTDGISVVCADLHNLPLKSLCADGLFTIDTLGHLHRQNSALDEINRVCKSGAPLFLHSECSDYQNRWPDREIVKRTNVDTIASIDGHIGICTADEMKTEYSKRFIVTKFYSPAGITGWCTGYPEKYVLALKNAGMKGPALVSAVMALLKKWVLTRIILKTLNFILNRIELILHVESGGSCFARAIKSRLNNSRENAAYNSIDIVIPTLNRSELIEEEVDILVNQCRLNDRIYVVWQGNSMPKLNNSERVVFLHIQKPSLTKARNTGIKAGMNRIVLFLDDDCIIDNGLIEAHRQCYASEKYGAVAGYVDDPLYEKGSMRSSEFDITRGAIYQHFNSDESGTAITLMGTNMSFLRRVLELTGGFDEWYTHNAVWEDIDMAFRVQNAGYTIYYCRDAAVRHLRHPVGGCRADKGLTYLFYFFLNTTYFACTYAPLIYIKKWCIFWLYHLEYFSRLTRGKKCPQLLKYNPLKVGAGCTGAMCGLVRYIIGGKRQRLPSIVVKKSAQFFGDN